MKIGVDLRGLNYGVYTGVNTYTIHFLYCLYNIKKTDPSLVLTAIGLDTKTYDKLSTDYDFIFGLFDEIMSINTYLGVRNLPTQNTISSSLIILYARLFNRLTWSGCAVFDIIFMVQPKPILLHHDTNMVCVFHDIFSVINSDTMSFRQKIIENKTIYRLLIDNSFKVFANSISTANDLKNFLGVDESKIRLVYPALPILKSVEFKKNKINNVITRADLPKKYMLCVSGVEPRKNWANIIKAFSYCQKNIPDFEHRLVFAGRVISDPYFDYIKNMIKIMELKNIQIILDISDDEKSMLYQKADFVLYPSFYEGFGFPILEAFREHKTVITSKISSMPELAREGAVYVNPLNYTEIASAMQILIQDRVFYAKLVSNISKTGENYSWDELENALRKLVVVDEIM